MNFLFDNFDILANAPDGIKKLREMILQLAVTGKLVPQDPDDEPAGVLLERIKEEKERLIKEGKIKRQKPLPEITEKEKLYELPKGWEWVRLGGIGQIVGGGTPKTGNSEFFSQNGIPWLTPADLYSLKGKYVSKGRRDISPLGLKKSSAQLLPAGTVLFSSRAPIGYVAIAVNELSTNQGFKSCVPYIRDINLYLYYYLKHSADEIDANATGTTFKEVSGKTVSLILCPLPPLNEQKRIVEKVDRLMALCDELEKKREKSYKKQFNLNNASLEKLLSSREPGEFQEHWQRITGNFDILYNNPENVAKLKQAILQLAIMGKLVPHDPTDEPASVLLKKIKEEKERLIKEGKIKKQKPLPPIIEDEKPNELPSGWEWVRLGTAAKIITDGTHLTPNYTNSGRMFLSAQNIKPFRFMPENHRFVSEDDYIYYTKNKKAEINDILLTRVGANIGEAAVVDKNIDFAIYVSLGLIKLFQDFSDPKYFVIWLNSPEGTKKAIENTYGYGVSQGNLNLNLINKFVISLPPLREQKRIVSKVEQLMSLCDRLEENLRKTEAKSDTLFNAVANRLIVPKSTAT